MAHIQRKSKRIFRFCIKNTYKLFYLWKRHIRLFLFILLSYYLIDRKTKQWKLVIVADKVIDNIKHEDVIKRINNLNLMFEGRSCRKKSIYDQRVAIIVPFRDRAEQLPVFIKHMHAFLCNQPVTYKIFLVEQAQNFTFNKGRVMNAGFKEALKNDKNWNCFIFHDVDLLPQNKLSFYNCRSQPTHFSAAIDKYNYMVPYNGIFGGVIGMYKEFFKKINGFSNEFWGWGGEDDNMRERVLATGVKFFRLPENLGRYKMLRHPQDIGNPTNPCRDKLINIATQRLNYDGLNNVYYKVIKKQENDLYTHILVDVVEENLKKKLYNACSTINLTLDLLNK